MRDAGWFSRLHSYGWNFVRPPTFFQPDSTYILLVTSGEGKDLQYYEDVQ
jgi:hypothetical protein